MHDFRLLEIILELSCIIPLMRETIKSDKLFQFGHKQYFRSRKLRNEVQLAQKVKNNNIANKN